MDTLKVLLTYKKKNLTSIFKWKNHAIGRLPTSISILQKTPLTNRKLAAKINLTVKLMKKKMSKSVQFLAKQEKLI